MSVSLTVVETEPQAPEAGVAITEQGRLAKMWSKTRAIGTAIKSTPRLPQFEQLRGLGSGAWLGGFVGSILFLNRFVSPLITTLAMSTLIIPVSALVLLILGEFDFTKLTTMVASNAGIVFATGGAIIAALFIQNNWKMALLIKSFSGESHRKYRTYALASVFTPVTTSAMWYLFSQLGYFMASKNLVLGIVAMFASGAVGEALSNVNPANVTTNELAAVANVMSNGLRIGLGVVICIHLWFVYLSYGLIHKTLNACFDFVVKKTVDDGWYEKSTQRVASTKIWVRQHPGRTVWYGILLIFAATLASAFVSYMHETPEELKVRERTEAEALVEERKQQAIAREQVWRVACINKQTFATEGGRAYRFTNRDGSSYCLNPVAARNITLGDPFSVGNSYRHDVIVHDAGGYDRECLDDSQHSMRKNGDGNCRIDVTIPRKNQYWLELPEGLPKGVQMPPVKIPTTPQ